jgi:hypothetical protein
LLFSRFSFFFLVEECRIPDNDDAASDGFDTQFPPHFEDELTSEQEGRTRGRRRKKKNKKVKNIYMSLVDKRNKQQAEICVG